MIRLKEKLCLFFNNRWLVFVAAMWIQSFAGIGYLFGSISPIIKSSLNYNQRQLSRLGVAKDLGDSVGFLAGTLSEILPLWAALLVGAIQNFIGYGWVWLIVTGRSPTLPLWVMCILIFIGTNGETYFNTAALVSCVQNFPKNRGPVVGILKGFAGLGGAIMTQIYALIHSPDHASLIFMVAVGPSMVVIALMFLIRPVGGHRQVRPSDGFSFSLIYSICIILASYLMGVMLVQDLVDVSHTVTTIFTAILFVLLVIPVVIPISLSFSQATRGPSEEALLSESQKQDPGVSKHNDDQEIIFSEVEDEKPKDVDLLPALERQKRIAQLQTKLAQAAAEGAVRIKRRRGPHRGEDFTLMQALIKADLWIIFFSLLLGSGSGLTVIDNLGQMSQSLGYDNTHVFVSMISIWNFLGRIGGGYFSEIIVRDYAYPRHAAMAVAQVIMAFGHFFFAMGWPGAMYIGTLLVGLGYGAHWAIVPAAASELFGLKNFGALYNFLTVANPAGSLVFSGIIASSIYDSEAAKQAQERHPSQWNGASILSSFLAVEEPLKCEGAICFFLTSLILCGLCIIAACLSMILVYRTKAVYNQLYGKSRT
ncbi:PREDICTED: protein NUCLEAR FUSION DEFECTIVE 4-like [Nicotiana attenuata]|uniref:Protein nuclear fusion defective 4 n=1 Tax=Nicotiana attenuata TaxID=49451 RepID=A0A1J6I9J6_NICAT|nr:PREDICTED: protein NUCLEAR FUSION DEFECTIVE 4-like [Nicotiana attenuata]OIS97199.1 protein nuclear fusion defective 4 [Nicotiana attenuata]